MSQSVKIGIVLLLAAAGIFITFTFPPLPQDQEYFLFADTRTLWGIPNFGDVISNIPFPIVGILGLLVLGAHWQDPSRFAERVEAIPFFIAFAGLILLGPCSTYFHWTPANDTQAWDRLPMTLVFMAFFSIIIAERIHRQAGLVLLPLLLAVGIASVIYWSITESRGHGDLRLYALVQFLPVLLIPLILCLFPPMYRGTRYIVEVIVWYGLAKGFEYFDSAIYTLTNEFISGHTIKHLAAALGIYGLVRYMKYREKI